MKHNKNNKKLNRTISHRKSLLKNLIMNLLYYKKIITTKAKSYFLRKNINKIIHSIKKNENINRCNINFVKKNIVSKNIKIIKMIINNCISINSNIEYKNYIKTKNILSSRSDGAKLVLISLI